MAASDPYTQAVWATAVLADANLPTTPTNVQNMERWMAAEEPPSNWWDRNNPLNASLGTSASDGTGSYPNLSAGAAYTAKMLQQSNMSGIYNALKNSASITVFSAAVVASPWASGHYGGNPNAIANIPIPTAVPAGTNPFASGSSAAGAATATTGPGSLIPGGGSSAAVGGACQQAGCFIGFTVPSAAGILFGGGHQGCVCLMSKSQWKAISGAAAIAAGAALAGFGIVLLASAVGKSTGATAAVGKVAKTVGVGASLLAGQPEAAAGIEGASLLKGGGGSSAKSTKSKSVPAPKAPEVPTAGRRESRQIERNYQSTVRQQGPIGPRGGNPTSTRIASQRRSTPGARPTTSEAQRRRREARAGQPF
jgi:hypothetical protein